MPDLRRPISACRWRIRSWPRPAPLVARPRRHPAARGRRRRGDRAASRCSRSRFDPGERGVRALQRGRRGEHRRSRCPTSRRPGRVASGPTRTSSWCAGARAGGGRARHRQPERRERARVGRLRARCMEAAGASAIELNIFYIPADPSATGREVEQRYEDVVARGQRAPCRFPVAVKLSPFFSAMGEMARRLVDGRRATASCSSTASTSPTSISTSSRCRRRWS